ncbi:hypothetical protein [Rhizobium etli]|uniref:Uncharacterized protein n=1 Tax=Rhizobium etli TaxID=29449 RepID=A0A7W6ZG70_RHIET|nr:hypothetical protein [Rhizobium etli]MBB4480106.1 hypothetical protein [Rhizobium etli]MBB4535569.1 hypothetical protein [Rhizobium etli]
MEFRRPLGREGSISLWRETDNQRLITPRQIIYHCRKSKLRNLNREVMSTLKSASTFGLAPPPIIVDPAIFVGLTSHLRSHRDRAA